MHAMRVPMESMAGRAARLARPAVPDQELPTLTERQLRTLQLTADGLSVEEVGLADGVAKTSVYERFDRIKERFGLPPNASIADVMMLAVYYGLSSRAVSCRPDGCNSGFPPDEPNIPEEFRLCSGQIAPHHNP